MNFGNARSGQLPNSFAAAGPPHHAPAGVQLVDGAAGLAPTLPRQGRARPQVRATLGRRRNADPETGCTDHNSLSCYRIGGSSRASRGAEWHADSSPPLRDSGVVAAETLRLFRNDHLIRQRQIHVPPARYLRSRLVSAGGARPSRSQGVCRLRRCRLQLRQW